jgi:general L-amino acid transport system permease protein
MLDFLSQAAGFDIGETGWVIYDASQPLWRALWVGLANTLRVCLPALLLAFTLGLSVALARYARLPLWSNMARVFVDVVRNVPLLLQLLIWYFLLVSWLPDSTEALQLLPGTWLSKGGLAFPWPVLAEPDPHWVWEWPEQGPFNVSGGASVTPEYLALALALGVYTAAFLSEVIRSGLEAVSPSLMEAAATLGATRSQQVLRVLIPQALRTLIPGTTNQILNLIKNSSLAVAVGYPDLVSVGNTTMNQTGRTVECLLVMMSVYLAMSLLTSALMNAFNRHYGQRGAA